MISRRLILCFAIGIVLDSAASAFDPPAAPEASVAKPRLERMVEWDEYTGRFEAVDSVEVRARVSGYLESIHFKEGALVAKGDLLFVIDRRPFETQVETAKANVARAQAQLDLQNTSIERAKKLIETQAISQEEYDAALAGVREAEAALTATRSLQHSAELDLEFTEVRSPIAGRVSSHYVTVGNLISGGTSTSTLLTTIVSLDPIHFVFDCSEAAYLKYARLAENGSRVSSREKPNPVQIRLFDEKTFGWQGAMDFVDNRINFDTGTMRGRAIVENPKGFLIPGLFGRVRLPGSGEQDTLLIPDSAIASDQSRKIVYVVKPDHQVEARAIVLGPLVRGLRVVREGLTAEDTIVVSGLQRLRPGVAISPKETQIELKAE